MNGLFKRFMNLGFTSIHKKNEYSVFKYESVFDESEYTLHVYYFISTPYIHIIVLTIVDHKSKLSKDYTFDDDTECSDTLFNEIFKRELREKSINSILNKSEDISH